MPNVYFRPGTGTSTAAMDPELAALSPQMQSDVKKMLDQLLAQDQPNRLHMIIGALEMSVDQLAKQPATPENAEKSKALAYVLTKLRGRLAEVEASPKPPATAPAAPAAPSATPATQPK